MAARPSNTRLPTRAIATAAAFFAAPAAMAAEGGAGFYLLGSRTTNAGIGESGMIHSSLG